MPTRLFKSGDPNGVPSGYEGPSPSDFRLPPCGVEDVDRSFFRTLRDEVAFQVGDDPGRQQKVPIVFAVGEKWSMLKSGRAIRDKDGTLVLPLITVRRVSVEQTAADVAGRGMNQHVGSFTVKTRLAPEDRAYQNVVNKLGVPNSEDTPGPRDFSGDGSLSTARPGTRRNADDLDVRDGGLLAPKLGDNVWQVITAPSPQFFTATYEMTMWAQYTEHMNQMQEKLMSSYLPTGNRSLRLDTEKGYWFVAYFDESQGSEDNVDNSTGEELVRKYRLTVKVPGYVFLSSAPGVPNGLRYTVSVPQIFFGTQAGDDSIRLVNGTPSSVDPYEAADDPSRQLLLGDPSQPVSVVAAGTPPGRTLVEVVPNPFRNGRSEPRFARVVYRDPSTGETTLVPAPGLELDVVDPE